ncbi:hypothetical protein JCM19274_4224 [Algibacter lectus]|nr:hypothetical protein JCM19274_4224 [Algibacter lectus]
MQAEQDKNAAGYSKANAVSRSVSKSSHLYKNKSWDLVDAEEMDEVVISDLTDDALPAELKGKSTEEIKGYIDIKRKEREDIQNEIQELNAKRKVYISKQKTEGNNGLENAMTNAIKAQAQKKNYTWK